MKPDDQKKSKNTTLGRRDFLKATAVTGATVGCSILVGCDNDTNCVCDQSTDASVNPDGSVVYDRESPHADRSDWKSWARENFQGVENETIPSFTSDFTRLSEEGIRLDIKQSIKHGFFSTLCAAEAGLIFSEAKDFVAIAADEAGNRILVSSTVLFDSFDQCFQMLEHAARVGCSHVLLGYPPSFNPQSEQEIYDITRQMCEAENIGIALYPKFDFSKISESAIVEILQDLVSIPNVISVKVFDGPLYENCQQLFSDTVLVASPNPFSLPANVKNFSQKWIGAGPYEVFQSPDKPYFVQMLDLLLQGNEQEGMEIYEKLLPLMESFIGRHVPNAMLGTYHWPEHKYYQWCSGGNGGYTRQPVMKITKATMEQVRADFESIGITPDTPDDMFYLGRANWTG